LAVARVPRGTEQSAATACTRAVDASDNFEAFPSAMDAALDANYVYALTSVNVATNPHFAVVRAPR